MESGSQESTDPRTDSKGPEPTVPLMFVDAFFFLGGGFLSCLKKERVFYLGEATTTEIGEMVGL